MFCLYYNMTGNLILQIKHDLIYTTKKIDYRLMHQNDPQTIYESFRAQYVIIYLKKL